MTAHEALALGRRHGVTVAVNGDRLKLSAPAEPPVAAIRVGSRFHFFALWRMNWMARAESRN